MRRRTPFWTVLGVLECIWSLLLIYGSGSIFLYFLFEGMSVGVLACFVLGGSAFVQAVAKLCAGGGPPITPLKVLVVGAQILGSLLAAYAFIVGNPTMQVLVAAGFLLSILTTVHFFMREDWGVPD